VRVGVGQETRVFPPFVRVPHLRPFLGYHVTLVKDATAAFSKEMMRAAHELNGPTFAHKILTTAELLAALPRE